MTRFWPFSLPLLTLACFFPPAIAQTIIPAQDGTATLVMPNGNTFNISGGTLSGDGRNLFHSFQEFGLSAQQIANFLANPQIQNILGRVTGGNPSIINGLIQVTGGNPNLFLMNPSGIVFGPNASLNVPANFAATTSTAIGFSGGQFNAYGVNNYQALVGNPNSFVFQGVTPGAIINAGNLAVNAGQDISLIGGTVINTGKISAPGGEITLSAVPGSSLVRISQTGQILSLEVPVPQDVQGNALPFKPTDLPTLLTTSGVNTGLTVTPTGTVAIAATGTPIPTSAGTNILSGQVSTANAQGLGGKIQATGTQVGLVNATLNASGQTGGGTVLIGGDYQGKGTLPNAQNTYVSQDSVIQANALTQGNGGKVIVWADGNTQFLGSIEAKGGVNGGDGGFAEVSGKQNLGFQGNVNLSATQGKLGNLLLDPENITIIDSTGAVNDSSLPNIPFDQDPGVNYTISNSALQALAGDTNIQLEAANNITIDPLTSTGGFLSFQPGTGTITFIANADNAGGGDFSMDTTNTISTAGRSLTIKGNNITVGGIQSSFSTVGGDVILQATSNLQANGLISTGGGSFTASGNDVAINNTVNTSSFTGTGGNVDLTGTNITVTPSSSAFSPAIQTGGGNVNATATGNLTINPSAITGIGTIDTSNFSAGTGGTVTLNTGGTNQIAGQVSTGGGNFTASGNDVVINNAVNTSNFSTGATGGGVNLTGTNITVTPSSTAFSSAIQTGGGSVNATDTNNLSSSA